MLSACRAQLTPLQCFFDLMDLACFFFVYVLNTSAVSSINFGVDTDVCKLLDTLFLFVALMPPSPPQPTTQGTWTSQKEERDITVVGRRTWLQICACAAHH